MSGSKKYSISLPEDLAEVLEQRVVMDKLRELVADFETDNDPLTREEIEAARARLNRERRDAGGAPA